MVIIGFKNGKEIELDIELLSIKQSVVNGKISSINWNKGDRDNLKWFDIDDVEYIIERGD